MSSISAPPSSNANSRSTGAPELPGTTQGVNRTWVATDMESIGMDDASERYASRSPSIRRDRQMETILLKYSVTFIIKWIIVWLRRKLTRLLEPRYWRASDHS
ncbi:hypothetical protein PHLCEN_2v1233 [Hermanssonia centrifuga]|uniref:Uncharacterized protein n=1 Tax=Hermanssonia centrifuga TaxID=98765 RepID=A0A2R6S3T6_9APHY|nr:hypothetical protein PHLCEN_2v1233 [Hermanssonia centrifuga]